MEIIDKILDLPVIVQGALGSGLFWLMFDIGQRLTTSISKRLSSDQKTAMWFSLAANVTKSHEMQIECRQIAIYGGLHYLIKALILIVVSLLLSPLNHIIAIVGYVSSVYFLFRALSYIPHTNRFGKGDAPNKLFEDLSNEAIDANK